MTATTVSVIFCFIYYDSFCLRFWRMSLADPTLVDFFCYSWTVTFCFLLLFLLQRNDNNDVTSLCAYSSGVYFTSLTAVHERVLLTLWANCTCV